MSPQLEFPLLWHGRVIAETAAGQVPQAILTVLRSFGVPHAEPQTGHVSRAGTYVTYRVQATFGDRITMEQIIYALSRIEGVRTIL